MIHPAKNKFWKKTLSFSEVPAVVFRMAPAIFSGQGGSTLLLSECMADSLVTELRAESVELFVVGAPVAIDVSGAVIANVTGTYERMATCFARGRQEK